MSGFVEAALQLVRRVPEATFVHGLKWRHHGLGVLQAEFTETLRVHIWHPKLVTLSGFRAVHDHRFDIESAVIYGTIRDIPYCVDPEKSQKPYLWMANSRWEETQCWEIQHAKLQGSHPEKLGCSTATDTKLLGTVWARATKPNVLTAPVVYRISRRDFHTTQVDDLAITVIHRSNFDDRLARVLGDASQSGTAIQPETLENRILRNWVLEEALSALAGMKEHD